MLKTPKISFENGPALPSFGMQGELRACLPPTAQQKCYLLVKEALAGIELYIVASQDSMVFKKNIYNSSFGVHKRRQKQSKTEV